jgi:hypothetical protein
MVLAMDRRPQQFYYHSMLTPRVEEPVLIAWQIGGLTMGDSGSLDRPIHTGGWSVPGHVEVHDGVLSWQASRPRLVQHGDGLLDDFLALSNASDEHIETYAGKWGVLHFGGSWAPTEGEEEVVEWRALAHHFKTLVTIAARVHSGSRVSPSEWAELGGASFVEVGPDRLILQLSQAESLTPSFNEPRSCISSLLTVWLRRSNIKLSFTWSTKVERPIIQLAPNSLVGALVLAVAFAVARTDGLAMCSECGTPFVPKRRPARGREAFCPSCGVKAARRAAQRRYRERRREGGD